MKTKLLYIWTSGYSDFYLEQALISIYSARLNNQNAHIALLTDDRTLLTCKTKLRKAFLEYFDEIICVDVEAFPDNMRRSRQIKTSAALNITGDFLLIDTDTVICENLDEIDSFDSDINMVADLHIQREYWELFYGKQRYDSFLSQL